jgi:hypothetical protein
VQVVERAFGLFKWKWGIFWRPLDIDEKNIRKVIEGTARLHNMCIDCKTSSCLTDFICHDDVFWQRTGKAQRKKPSRYLLPDFQERQLLPDYADAATIAAHTGVAVDAGQERSTRQRVCQHVVDLGLEAPTVISPAKRLERVCGINSAQHIPFKTRAIGKVSN